MRCGSQSFNVCTLNRISEDVNILTSADTGFADVNTAIFGFADVNAAMFGDLWTLTQQDFGFADLRSTKSVSADLIISIFWICGS
jgi:hypothetical protein